MEKFTAANLTEPYNGNFKGTGYFKTTLARGAEQKHNYLCDYKYIS